MNDSEKLRTIMAAVKVEKIIPFAALVHVSKSLIGGILNGDRSLTDNLKLRLEKYLSINPDWFENPDSPLFLPEEPSMASITSKVESLLDTNPELKRIMEISTALSPKKRRALLTFLETLKEEED